VSDQETDLATAEQEPPALLERAAPFLLEVVEGPNRGTTFTLDPDAPGPVLIGQSSACALRLADRQVSRRHASLDPRDGRLYLVDLGSTNGTVVNGLTVERAWLVGGETVRVGTTTLRVERGAARLGRATARDRFGRLLGSSTVMTRLYGLCDRLAATAAPALIEGEHGTGKELLAESLHETGPFKQGPFVVFDCSVEGDADPLAETDGESAVTAARGGTLFIREIAELGSEAQGRLAAWLEQQAALPPASRVGSPYDVRLIASSYRDLDREVHHGRFHAGLLERLAENRIELPPLRARKGDVPTLAKRFWAELQGGAAGAPNVADLARLEDNPFPGNVRELRAEVARLAGRNAGPEAKTESIEEVLALDLPFSQARQRALREFQRRYVERVLARHNGNVSRAAEAAGIARRYFQIIKARKLTNDG
jgi:DNA-binding NtrC family response regulator